MAKTKYLLVGAPLLGVLMLIGVWWRGGRRQADDKEVRRLRAQLFAMELEMKERDSEIVDLKQRGGKSLGVKRVQGVLPAGDDMGGDPRSLTVHEALRVCKATDGCAGFTYASKNPDPGKRVTVYFKTAFKVAAADGWWSYAIKTNVQEAADPGYPVYLRHAAAIEADYNVSDVARRGAAGYMEQWPEYEYPIEPAFRYPKAGVGVVTLAVSPRVVLREKTVGEEVAREIVEKARGLLSRSLVANDKKHLNESGVKSVRTSSGAWLNDDFEPAEKLRDVIQGWVGVDRVDFESLQILRYEAGQKYGSHVDYFHPSAYGKKSWNRMATVITFLNTVHVGGESNFPIAHSHTPKPTQDCSHGLRVHPTIGHSVLFYSMRPDLNFDHFSLHGGCPVGPGEEKWVAIQWLHVNLPHGLPPESL